MLKLLALISLISKTFGATATLKAIDISGTINDEDTATYTITENNPFTLKVWLGGSKQGLHKISLEIESFSAICSLKLKSPRWKKPAVIGKDFAACDWPERNFSNDKIKLAFDVRSIQEFYAD